MEKPLVSIITPCYNGEMFLKRYFDSILNQTYENIELIFINDGSTDNTKDIVDEYKIKFFKKNVEFKYIYQENKGQAAAVNRGLKEFCGDYLMWPDSDDFLEKNAIEKEVEFLEKNQEFGLVRVEANIVEETSNEIVGKFEIKDINKTNIFEDLIFKNNVFYSPVSYMVRSQAFLEVNPNREIFETRYGQNWQMLLPITHKYKCGCIKEKLSVYYIRKNSHSRQKTKIIDEEFFKLDKHHEILFNVLSEIGVYENYKEKIEDMYNLKKMNVSFSYFDRERTKYYWELIKNKNIINKKEKIKLLIVNNILLFFCFKIIHKIKNKIKGKVSND